MAKETTTPVDGVQPEATINPAAVPGTAKTILSTRVGYTFESGVDGVDIITEHGTRVAKDKVEAVLAAAEPQGSGFITVTTDEG